jgi:DNA polymerase-4
LPAIGRLGVRTVADLRRQPPAALQRVLGAHLAAALLAQSEGVASSAVVPETARKSISKETTFAEDLTDPATLHARLRVLAGEVARGVRAAGAAGGVVMLKVRFAGFETHTRQRRLGHPTDSERELLAEAWRLFEHGGLPRAPVRLIGVGLAGLTAPQPRQPDLFESADAGARDVRLVRTLDAVKARFGDAALGFGLGRKSAAPRPADASPTPARGSAPDEHCC